MASSSHHDSDAGLEDGIQAKKLKTHVYFND
jgi:hypothetical protein